MERTTGSETKSKIVVFINEVSTTVIPFANYVMSQDRGESFNSRRWLPTAGVGAGQANRMWPSKGNSTRGTVPLRARIQGQRTEVVFNRGQRERKRGHPVYRTPTP
jgi:hypothetical protein